MRQGRSAGNPQKHKESLQTNLIGGAKRPQAPPKAGLYVILCRQFNNVVTSSQHVVTFKYANASVKIIQHAINL